MATFFRKSKFAAAMTWWKKPTRVALDNGGDDDDDAFGLVLVLENRKNRSVVVTGNAHVLFAPKNGLVKLAGENDLGRWERGVAAVIVFSSDENFLVGWQLFAKLGVV